MRRKRTGIRCRIKSAGRKPARLCFRQPAPVFSFILAGALLAGTSSHAAFFVQENETAAELNPRSQEMALFPAAAGLLQDGRVWADPEAEKPEGSFESEPDQQLNSSESGAGETDESYGPETETDETCSETDAAECVQSFEADAA